MNGKSILAVTAGLVAALTTTSASMADTNSDQNLRYSRAYIERAYDMLSHDQSVYGGHRVAAMGDLSQARADLTEALHYDRNPEDASIPGGPRPEDTDISNFVRNQHGSTENLEFTHSYIEHAIDMLQRDAHDYNGYRAKAVAALEAARTQISAAVAYRDSHPTGNGPGGVASDDNLRYSRLYLNRAVSMLQHDMHDYAGHRAAAVNDIQAAQADLTAALRYDSNKGDATIPTHAMASDAGLESYFVRGQFGSTQNIEYVRQYVERAIDMLSRDAHDYGGDRVKAVASLQDARQQLLLAVKSR
jgi:tetratricopeptide (TPR) repeat protein